MVPRDLLCVHSAVLCALCGEIAVKHLNRRERRGPQSLRRENLDTSALCIEFEVLDSVHGNFRGTIS